MAERRFAALATLRNRPATEALVEAAESTPDAVPAAQPAEQREEIPPPVAEAQPAPAPPPPAAAPASPKQAAFVQAAPILTAPALTPVGQGRGRPPGKRSDPDWKPRTILMRTKTHRRVSGLLLDQDDSPDLSELIDGLLRDWITKQA